MTFLQLNQIIETTAMSIDNKCVWLTIKKTGIEVSLEKDNKERLELITQRNEIRRFKTLDSAFAVANKISFGIPVQVLDLRIDDNIPA